MLKKTTLKKISADDARRILADVSPGQCFWVNNGPIVRNIYEMADVLANIKDETFRHHVNSEKNDIANWARDVLKDDELALSISKASSNSRIRKTIQRRIKFLEKKSYTTF